MMRSSTAYTRPEAALNRAKEFISVGKKKDALQALHDIMKDRRHKIWTPTHESIMEKYVELCVDLKNSSYAKDGMYQYKALTQQTNLPSLEKIITKYLELAEKKTEEARKSSAEKVEEIDDLDAGDAPENLLLSVVSGAVTQDRMDRAVLSPWLRFLWDSYRNCLDLLRNNYLVEKMYHGVAEQSFNFCQKYQRRNEFRKLCDLLRNHLGQIQKSQNQQNPNVVKLTNPDSVALIQETRHRQLDTAIHMELWQEAYKSSEDLHAVISIKDKEQTKKAQKPQSFVSYYDKLSLIFWKGGNSLLHTAALLQKFGIYRDLKKTFADEEEHATRILLAALSIADGAENPSMLSKILDIEEVHSNNMRNLSNLLRLSFAPTREGIIKEIVRFGIPEVANAAVASLYRSIEQEFNPLRISAHASECLAEVEALGRADLGQYYEPIKLAVSSKVIKQLANTYETMPFANLGKIIPFYKRLELECLLVEICKQLLIKVQISHQNGCILFEPTGSSIPEDGGKSRETGVSSVRAQLESMYTSLLDNFIEIAGDVLTDKSLTMLRDFIQRYEASKEIDYEGILLRRKKIEGYKESSEKLKQEKAYQVQVEANRKEEKRRIEEQRKLFEESKENERLRKKAEQEEVQKKIQQDKLHKLQQTPMFHQMLKDYGGELPADVDPEFFFIEQKRRIDQGRKEQQTRLQQQEKKFDHMVRAFHIEETEIRSKMSEEKRLAAPSLHEISEESRISNAIKDHERSILAYSHLTAALADAKSFLKQVIESNASDLQKQHNAWLADLESACVKKEAEIERKAEEEARRKAEEEMKRMALDEERKEKKVYEEANQDNESSSLTAPQAVQPTQNELSDPAQKRPSVYRPPMMSTAAAPSSERPGAAATPVDPKRVNVRAPPNREVPVRGTPQNTTQNPKAESDTNWRKATVQ